MSSERIRVLVAEDDSVLRRTLTELIRLEPDLLVVSEVANGLQAVSEAVVVRPDVILMDIEMPRLNGIEATRQIREKLPHAQVVILTKFGDDENVFSAIKAGALGYILKDSRLDEIVGVVRSAYQGEGSLSPALVTRVMSEFTRLSQSAIHNRKLFAELSRREVEVLECLAAGMKNAAIADKLFLSEKTVKSHVGSILKKLHVNDRAEAAMLAKESGITANQSD
ncbi:MAG: response regulator transcription factor [Fimbriimonas sp.]|nr:response regulator transcription factor [Fimbriimonas sp.]